MATPIVILTPTTPTRRQIEECGALLAYLVRDGAALGWVDPPSLGEIEGLFRDLVDLAKEGNAAVVFAERDGRIVGGGYWRRYARPTHRPHADVERIFIDPAWHGQGIGRRIVDALVDAARAARVEVLTLDFRADNVAAERLYASAGFEEYGRLRDFVAVGDQRFDKRLFALDLRAR